MTAPDAVVPDAARTEVAPPVEAVSSLELERSVFDSTETEILSAAFEKAWTYVEFDPDLGALGADERRSELARCLMVLLKLGDTDPISIANSAIALLRKGRPRTVREDTPRD